MIRVKFGLHFTPYFPSIPAVMTAFREINPSANRIFESVLKQVRDDFQIERKDNLTGLKLLSRFDGLKGYRQLFVHKVTEFKKHSNSFIILLMEKHLIITENKSRYGVFATQEREIEEIEPLLIFSLQHDVGKVMIKNETLTDKLADLFTKIDIDFPDYPSFSSNYLVVGEKPELVKKFLPKGLLATLDSIKNMTIEIEGNWGLLRIEKNLTEDLLLGLIGMGARITK